MKQLPQLYLRHPNLEKIPPLNIPDGLEIVTHTDDMVEKWEEVTFKAFGVKRTFENCIVKSNSVGGYKPEHVLYLVDGKKVLATVTATERDDFPGEGWFRMVATDPEFQGRGYGKLICLAALHKLKERGYKTVVLSTDDYRFPALRTYLGLGFEPMYTHESHERRWGKLKDLL